MTYEDFKRMALNPPRHNEDTIFEITRREIAWSWERRRIRYPKFPVTEFRIGFSHSLTGAEELIGKAVSDAAKRGNADDIYCFHVKEYPVDMFDWMGCYNYGVAWRLYDRTGKLLDHSWCSSMERDFNTEFGKFRGRPDESIRFKAGDIVEVYDAREKCIKLAVATQSPINIDWCWGYRGRCREELSPGTPDDMELGWYYGLDFSDDQAAVIDGPGYEYHQHIPTFDIMPLSLPLSDKLRRRYEGFWEACQKQDATETSPTIVHHTISDKKITDLSIFDNLDIEPGYAAIYSHTFTYSNIFAKATLEENGFTVLECYPPCDELNNTIVVRRINRPNLEEKAYVYIKFGCNTEDLQAFCKTALDIEDPRKGHLHFVRDEDQPSTFK